MSDWFNAHVLPARTAMKQRDKAAKLQRRLDIIERTQPMDASVGEIIDALVASKHLNRDAIAELGRLQAAQREPDERVREALEYFRIADGPHEAYGHGRALAAEVRRLTEKGLQQAFDYQRQIIGLEDEVRRLQALHLERTKLTHAALVERDEARAELAAQREPHPQRDDLEAELSKARQGMEFYRLLAEAQRDDHPTEGLLREAREFIANTSRRVIGSDNWGPIYATPQGDAAALLAKLDAALAAPKETR